MLKNLVIVVHPPLRLGCVVVLLVEDVMIVGLPVVLLVLQPTVIVVLLHHVHPMLGVMMIVVRDVVLLAHGGFALLAQWSSR